MSREEAQEARGSVTESARRRVWCWESRWEVFLIQCIYIFKVSKKYFMNKSRCNQSNGVQSHILLSYKIAEFIIYLTIGINLGISTNIGHFRWSTLGIYPRVTSAKITFILFYIQTSTRLASLTDWTKYGFVKAKRISFQRTFNLIWLCRLLT